LYPVFFPFQWQSRTSALPQLRANALMRGCFYLRLSTEPQPQQYLYIELDA